MAYVPQIGEFEDEGLGRLRGKVILTSSVYYINGKKVTEKEYYSTLKKLTDEKAKNINEKLAPLYAEKNRIDNLVADLERQYQNIQKQIIQENKFETKQVRKATNI